jgi:arylsulfatase A-like enzyme
MQTCCEKDQTIIDFWHTDRGASDVNSTGYSEWLYRDELVGVVQKHEPTTPLLVFYAPHVAHCPLQVPKAYYDKFSFMEDDEGHCAAQTVKGLHSIDPHFPDMEYKCRQQYHVSSASPPSDKLTGAAYIHAKWRVDDLCTAEWVLYMFSVLSACSVFLTIRSFQAMVMIMDEVVGNITQAFKVKQMWDNTLVVMSSDNVRPCA